MKLTKKDKELLDEAYTTTYKSTIRDCIKEAESEKCKKILKGLLSDPEMIWDD